MITPPQPRLTYSEAERVGLALRRRERRSGALVRGGDNQIAKA